MEGLQDKDTAVGEGRRDDDGVAPSDDATFAIDGTNGRRENSAAGPEATADAAAAVGDGRRDDDDVACSDDAAPATEATDVGVGDR